MELVPNEPRLLTLDEWAELPEDEEGELVDGVLVEEEMASALHDLVVGWLLGTLRLWCVPRGGLVLASDVRYGVRTVPPRGRKPDVTVFLSGRRRPPKRGLVRVPPDIAVEVVSPQPGDVRRDRVSKPPEYAAFGVRFYWIVDPWARTLEVFELGKDGRYVRALGASDGTIGEVPGCEGLELEFDALWAECDLLPDDDGDAPG